MQPPPLGASATLAIVVSAAMTARFDDEAVHPVYGTAALVEHMEQVSRRLLKPRLEPGEEGVGAELSVRQTAPVPVGGRVELVARVIAASPTRLVTVIAAHHDGRVVAEGTFTQAVVDRVAFHARVGLPPA